jgi:hypothetical protein
MDQRGDPKHRRRIILATAAQPLLQCGATRAGDPRAIAADRNKAIDVEACRKDLGQPAAHRRPDESQGWHGNAGQRFLKALAGGSRSAAFLVQGDVKSAGRLEAFLRGVAGAPGQDQQDKDQRLGLPARGFARPERQKDLFPQLRCEKVTQAIQERLQLNGGRRSPRSNTKHSRFSVRWNS